MILYNESSMDVKSDNIQGQGTNPNRLNELEQELEALKTLAQNVYQGKQTQSPVREKVNQSLTSVESGVTPLRPTYIEESTIGTSTRLGQASVPQGKKGAINIVYRAGAALLAVALIAAAVFLVSKII